MKAIADQAGFTLVEAMLCMALIGSFVYYGTTYFTQSHAQLRAARSIGSRDKIRSTIERYASLISALRISSIQSANSELLNCMTVPMSFLPNEPGTNCDGRKWYDFDLYPPIVDPSTGKVSSSGAVSGGPGTPGRFNVRGEACPTGASVSPDCPLEVTTEWKPQCPPQPGTALPAQQCAVPELMLVKYLIAKAAGANPAAEDVKSFQTMSGVVATRWMDLRNTTPSLTKIYIPPPPPPPPPGGSSSGSSGSGSSGSGSTGSGSSGSGSSSSSASSSGSSGNAPPPPPAPISCPGDTIQSGAYACACPAGLQLVNKQGKCAVVSI
jgi:uncharacterized membrane protein YgcG